MPSLSSSPRMRSAPQRGLRCPLPKLGREAGRWATVMRAMERNVPRTRSVGCSSRGAQNPHRPHTREPSAPAAARPAPPQIEATEIRATRSRLLDVALAVVDTAERSAPCRKAADGNSLAPAELSRFLDLEEASFLARVASYLAGLTPIV